MTNKTTPDETIKRTDISESVWFSNKHPDLYWKDPRQKPANCTRYIRADSPEYVIIKRSELEGMKSVADTTMSDRFCRLISIHKSKVRNKLIDELLER